MEKNGRGLEINKGKTKLMRCRKGGWKNSNWRGNTIEKVREFRYLGYIVKFNVLEIVTKR